MTLIKVGKNEEGEQLYMGTVQEFDGKECAYCKHKTHLKPFELKDGTIILLCKECKDELTCTRCGEQDELVKGLCVSNCKDDMNI